MRVVRILLSLVRLALFELAELVTGARVLVLAAALAAVFGAAAARVYPFATAHLQSTTVSCATSRTEINPTSHTASMYVANSSTTCVRLGGTGVTTSTGMSIGSGCRDGSGASFAFNAVTCISTGAGAVTVDVAYEDN